MSKRVIYREVPASGSIPDPNATFAVVESGDTQAIVDGEVLVDNQFLSVDAYQRFALYDDTEFGSQFPAATIGSVLGTYGVGQIVRSKNPEFSVGAMVHGWVRWEQQTVVSAADTDHLELIDDGIDPLWYLGPLGAPGLAAYAGLTEVGRPKRGETIVVPATSGAVGSVVAALARNRGLRIVGSAGSESKARALRESGVDAVVDHRSVETLAEQLVAACPDGIDIYFELVGGPLMDAALRLLNVGARIPFAGLLTQYNLAPEDQYGIRNLGRILAMDITIRSFDNYDFLHLRPEMRSELVPMLQSGALQFTPHVTAGVESMPQALVDIFTSRAKGPRIADVRTVVTN